MLQMYVMVTVVSKPCTNDVYPPLQQAWRELYALGCSIKAVAMHARYPDRPEAILRVLDLGIIMGGAHLHRVLQDAAQKLHDAAQGVENTVVRGVLGREPHVAVVLPAGSCADAASPIASPLPRLHCPSLDTFVAQCMVPARPTVLTGTTC